MLLEHMNVSRETSERLAQYVDLLKKWNPKINLISRSSIEDVWERHIADSVQVFQSAPVEGKWVDLGSGGGLPGIVVAICRQDIQPNTCVMIESDQRKAAFLRTCIRELDLDASVICDRVERVEPQRAQVLSARALADLSVLLGYAERHMASDGTAVFPKGQTWQQELEKSKTMWSCDCEVIKSTTNPAAAILKIKDIVRV